MNDADFKTFERDVLTFLKTIGFKPTGYYPYEHFSDVTGYLSPQPPFKNATSAMVEILRIEPTASIIENFYKLSSDSLADKKIIVIPSDEETLGRIRDKIKEFGIELFDRKTTLSAKKSVQKPGEKLQELDEILSPQLLVAGLPEVAHQMIPHSLESTVTNLGLKHWQVFEDIVYAAFARCFNYPTQKLGRETLFEHEPEGVVTVDRRERYCLLYECKSARESYELTSDHMLRYIDYIEKKIEEAPVVHGCDLKYFIVIAHEFSGDLGKKRQKIFDKTHVMPVFLRAQSLSRIAGWVYNIPPDFRKLIDLRSIFIITEDVVSDDTIEKYVAEFESKYRKKGW